MSSVDRRGVTGRRNRVQGSAARACRALVGVLLLAGCGSEPPSLNPVDWWHDLEGGQIAASRPPPPNADQPYPNLNTVQARPAPTSAELRAKISAGLVADRANANYAASLAPLAPPAPSPRPAPAPAPPADGTEVSSASLPAASAPPPPRPAPRAPVQSAPLGAPPPAGSADAALPDIPPKPPAAPQLAGVAAVTAPTPPPVAPPPPAPPPPTPGAPLSVAFAPGSATLSADATRALRSIAGQRGQESVAVVGYGEASSDAPADQSGALPLALSRARAIAAALVADGVPDSAIRVSAQAVGSGGVARVVP